MHDISDNKYLVLREISLQEYSIKDFLRGERALPKRVDVDKICLAIANIISMLGFNFRLTGYNFLIMLVSQYIVKHDYSESKAINSVADLCGTDQAVVSDNIVAVIKHNSDLIRIANSVLPVSVSINGTPTISETVNIIGAIYKIYYNYITDTEALPDEDNPAINLNRIVFKSGY